jgi:DNA (cytosine-5)-methyltransferase 1
MTKRFTAVDLFCGAGGLSEGFRAAGFSILAANDFDTHSEATFRETHRDTSFISGKIEDISVRALLSATGLRRGELDCLIGGPPCQAFSVYNHQRGMHDERSGLFREYLRIVEGLRPKFVVMENVTGITSVDNGRAVREIEARLTQMGYALQHKVLRAEEYGVPQERRRIFFVGSRDGVHFEWPRQTHYSTAELVAGCLPYVTVDEAIGDLPLLGISEGEEIQEYSALPTSAFQNEMRKKSSRLFNHVAPYLAPINRQRLKHIPQGGSWRDIPTRLLPAGMKLARRCDHTKRYGRLRPEGLASTILTKCDLHWGAYIHPHQDRTLTVREAARLQSFPDRFHFCGPRIEQYRQVGNAVPPLLARAVALSVGRCLKRNNRTRKEFASHVG